MATELEEIRKLSAKKFEKKLQDRPYQSRIITSVSDDWMGNNEYGVQVKSPLIMSPPGSGKTVMGFKLAKFFKENCGNIAGYNPSDVGIAWVAGRRNLLQQAEVENNAMIKCPDVHFLSQFMTDFSNHPINDYKHTLLIVDEAHHEACASMHNLINHIDPSHMLGLSATPQRTDGAKLCFQKTYQDAGFYTLIDEGWLADFEHWVISDWDPHTVVQRYLADKEMWGKSIMFFPNREDCNAAMLGLLAAGVKADLVTGETDRETQLERFENDELEVLVNMFVLTEGMNCPTLKTVFVRDSSQLPTIQMAGRVLRPHEDIPVTNIVQSMKTRWPFTRTANIAKRQHVWHGNSWRYVGRSDIVDRIACDTIRKLAEVPVDDEIHKKLRSMRKKRGRARRRQ